MTLPFYAAPRSGAGTIPTGGGGGGGPALPQVQPVPARTLLDGYGVCAHPSFQTSVYRPANQAAWFAKVTAMGATRIRSLFNQNLQGCLNAAENCRTFGLKMGVLVVNEDGASATTQTVQATTDRVNYLADHYPDVVAYIEGLNEPNQNRNTKDTDPDWTTKARAHQVAIWNAVTGTRNASKWVGGRPLVLSPSLHDTFADRATPNHYDVLFDAMGEAYFDRVGIHRYPGGQPPENALLSRVSVIRNAGFTKPIHLTEWGYHNALATTAGHKPASEAAAAVYGPRGLLGIVGDTGRTKGVVALERYELLDDVDAGVKDEDQANFGLVRVGGLDPSTWSDKPEVTAMDTLLTELADTAVGYVPPPVGLSVTPPAGVTDVRRVVVGRSDGSVRCYLWREQSVWNPTTLTAIVVPAADVTVTDVVGARTVSVGASVVSVQVRRS